MGASPPTSTLSYIFPLENKRSRWGSPACRPLTQPAAPSEQRPGTRNTSPCPDWRPGQPGSGGALVLKCQRLSPPVSPPVPPPVPGGKREVACADWGPWEGTLSGGQRTRRLHLEGAPISSLPCRRKSPTAPEVRRREAGSVRSRRGGGVSEHFLQRSGTPGLLLGEDSGWGWEPRAAPPPPGRAAGG